MHFTEIIRSLYSLCTYIEYFYISIRTTTWFQLCVLMFLFPIYIVTILNKCSVYPPGYYLKYDSNISYYNYSTKIEFVSMPFIFRSVFVSHYLYFVQYALLNICPHSLPQIRTGPEIHTSPTQRIHLVFPFNFLQATAIGHSI